jgi:D-alanine-D-alanine ligase
VIVKSTYEAWSVGVTDASVFIVGDDLDDRVAAISESIGQSVTVQRFVAGREVCVPIVSCPVPEVAPPVEQVLAKAPRDAEAFFTIGDNLDAAAVSYVPFSCDEDTWEQMRATSHSTFEHLQMRGVGRMDFRVDATGMPWLTDVAISPSWDRASSIFASLSQLGLDYDAFLRVLLASAISTRAPWSTG